MTENEAKDGGVAEAREVIAALAAATTAAALYPENHATREETVRRLSERLTRFLSTRDTLRVRVFPDRLDYGDVPVHADLDRRGLPGILFRDGIRWIAFLRGVTPVEVRGLLDLLGRHRNPAGPREGDIATELWSAPFPRIAHEAEDPLAASEPLDLSRINRGSAGGCWGDARADTDAPGLSPDDDALWTLNPGELEEIGRMVAAEENWEGTADVLDVLAVILEEQADPEDFGAILSFVEEEFQLVLEAGDFGLAVNLLRRLRRLRAEFVTDRTWAVPLLDDAFRDLSGPRFLSIFAEVDLDLLGKASLDSVRTLLSLLPPSALGTLIPMVPAARSRRARQVLTTAIVRLAGRDARPLNAFLEGTPPPDLARYLIEIVRRLSGGTAARLLFRLIRHPDERVRGRALRALLSLDEGRPEVIAPLLNDPDPAIREAVHGRLGRRRDRGAERLLTAWLRDHANGDAPGRSAAIRTLGRCGSDAALPMLRKLLFGRPWRTTASRNGLREAAARAIADLDSEAAESLLARAARSPFPAVRHTAWRILEDRP